MRHFCRTPPIDRRPFCGGNASKVLRSLSHCQNRTPIRKKAYPMAVFCSFLRDESFEFLCWFSSRSVPTQSVLVPVYSMWYLTGVSAHASTPSIRLMSVVRESPLSVLFMSFTVLQHFVISTATLVHRNDRKRDIYWTWSERTQMKPRLNIVSFSAPLLHVNVAPKDFILDKLFLLFSPALGRKTSRRSFLRLFTCSKHFMTRHKIRAIYVPN